MKKKRKDLKNKDKASEVAIPCKCTRDKDEGSQVKDKMASKKPKLKETIVIEEDKGR